MAKIRNSGTIINTDYLASKIMDGSLTDLVIPSNVSDIRRAGFAFCSKLVSLHIPKNVKTISTSAFEGCSSLTNITFEDNGLTRIGYSAFTSCSSLIELRFPNSLLSTDTYTFNSCSNLTKIIVQSATTIGDRSFINCGNMAYVFLIGDNNIRASESTGCFQNCNKMRLFDMRNMLSAKDKALYNTFTANSIYLYINVPDNLYDEFTAKTNWNALTLKRWVHSCDVASFEEIQNPIDGDYYSLKNDTNYLNPLGEKQLDVRQFVNNEWIEIDIDA